MTDDTNAVFYGVEPGAKVFWLHINGLVPDDLDVRGAESMARESIPGEWDGIIFHGEYPGGCFIAFTTGLSVSEKWTVVKRISTKTKVIEQSGKEREP